MEKRAAVDIAAKLSGPDKEVRVSASFDSPFHALGGNVASATITARNFSVNGLPLFTEPWRSKAGRVGTLHLRLYDFMLRDLPVEELRADIRSCRFDLGLALREKKVRLSKSGEGPGYVRVTADALERFVLEKYREITSISIRLEKYKLFAEGEGDFLVFKSRFYVIADIVPKNGTELWLANAVVFLDDKRVRDGSDAAILDTLNPVIDQNEDLGLHGALRLERVEIRNGFVELFGTARIPEAPTAKLP